MHASGTMCQKGTLEHSRLTHVATLLSNLGCRDKLTLDIRIEPKLPNFYLGLNPHSPKADDGNIKNNKKRLNRLLRYEKEIQLSQVAAQLA